MNETPEPRPGAKMPFRARLRPLMAALAGGIAGSLVVVLVEPSVIHLGGDLAAAHPASPSAVVSLIPGPAGPAGAPGPATAATTLAVPRAAATGTLSVVGSAAPLPSHTARPASLPSPAAVMGSLPKPPLATPELPAPPAPPAFVVPDVPTVVAFAGPSGEFITQGRSYQYTPPNSLITIQEDTGQAGACPGASLAPGGHITVHVRASTVWMIDLASPSGQPLAPGTYSRVDRYPVFCSPKVGGFALSGDGRGCNVLTADFTIRELTLAPDGSVAHLDVRFDQSCERSVSLARGAIRYQATVPA